MTSPDGVYGTRNVGHHRLGAGGAQPLRVGLAAADADNLVADGDELAVSGVPTAPDAPASSTLMAPVPFSRPHLETGYPCGV